MKDIEVTLYDIFGYLGPGIVAFVGLYLLVWQLALAESQDWSRLAAGGWAAILIIAYLLGHLVQALSNILTRVIGWSPEESVLGEIRTGSPEIINRAVAKACQVIGLPDQTLLSNPVLHDVADHYLQQNGKTECRDIYIYREGFYRGLAVALLILGVGALTRMIGPEGKLAIFETSIPISSGILGGFGALSLVMAYLAFRRFQRFSIYRVKNSLFGFIAIDKSSETGGQHA